ncbi:Fur family transcriptional regulator [Acetobacterium wieringae]|uniref:Fur family transcriptional regulator n=1 Tax=Acetobacterium wieringae TaxID=52694 RepID=UPI00203451CC|nr:transcriptional repressor [Acetobacterium wieringae]URN84078.1 transcriptional repressor [Acetobacterium wieringae]
MKMIFKFILSGGKNGKTVLLQNKATGYNPEVFDFQKNQHITVTMIAEFLEKQGTPVGVTTIYRHLDKLVEQGELQKYIIDGVTSACFQYIGDEAHCHEHFHLKCENCGTLIHLECGYMNDLYTHVLKHHAFDINSFKTVFYGLCKGCSDKKNHTEAL